MAGDAQAIKLDSETAHSAGRTDVRASERQTAWINRVRSAAKPAELVETIRAFIDANGIAELWLIDLQSHKPGNSSWQGWHVGEGAIEFRPTFVQEALRQLATAELEQSVDISPLSARCPINRQRLAGLQAQHSNGLEFPMFADIAQSPQLSELVVWAYSNPTRAQGCSQHRLVIDRIAQQKIALKEQATLPALRCTLTKRERECISMTSLGYSEKQIAKELDISPYTVRVHIENIKKKLGARNKIHAVVIALSSHQVDQGIRTLQNHAKVPNLLPGEQPDTPGSADVVDIVFDCIDGRRTFKEDRLLRHASFRCPLDPRRFLDIGKLG